MSYQISWSINEEYIYIYDDVEENAIVSVKFADYKKTTKKQKIALLDALTKSLSHSEDKGRIT